MILYVVNGYFVKKTNNKMNRNNEQPMNKYDVTGNINALC